MAGALVCSQAPLFERAAERLPGLMQAASREQLLYLYARYKQVKFGNCNTPKPSFFDFEGKQKWGAWKALGDSSPHQAMQEYIATERYGKKYTLHNRINFCMLWNLLLLWVGGGNSDNM
uniref:Acyl-CoA-binding domain-containing protein 6 n=1 Tax=Chelydra serpentina TaxID=8475 RepID=A0A8C3SCV2_CHESE